MKEILNNVLKECELLFDQSFNIPLERKEIYGEVKTDFKLIRDMFELIPGHLFKNPGIRWCDPCCGNGYFSIYLYFQLLKFQKNDTKKTSLKKKHHIINQITMVE